MQWVWLFIYNSVFINVSSIFITGSPNSENQEHGTFVGCFIITDHTYACVPYLSLKYK